MRRSWRCMAALLLMIMILVSGGCQNIRHLSVSQSEKDDADTGTGYNIYYINNDETKIKAFAYTIGSAKGLNQILRLHGLSIDKESR